MRISILYFFYLLIVQACWGQTYSNIATELGVHHTFGQDAFGGGVSFYDFDQDGWDDLTFTTHALDSVKFFKNNEGVFEELYFEGIHHYGHAKQVLWCDYDNDGDQDLIITGRSWFNFLYINDGEFTFEPYLLAAPEGFEAADTYGASWGDLDLDGDLDLFISNRVYFDDIPNQLFLNNGDGTLTDITQNYPIIDTTYRLTFCTAWIDYDHDLLPDLFTADDRFQPNQLLKNHGEGQLEDNCDDCGFEIIFDAMSLSPGDYDNDGDLDIYMSNNEDGNVLHHNNGDGTFTDTAAFAGLGFYSNCWGATFFDYDNDTDLDLYVSAANGGVGLQSLLFENLDLQTFSEADAGFEGDTTRSFSHAIGDVNNDGYYDIAVLDILPDSSQLWKSSGGTNNWLKIKLQGTESNRDGIGSWIEVWCEGLKQVKYTTCGIGYIAQNSASEIFGLGDANVVDSVLVQWTSGITNKWCDVEPNQSLLLVEGTNDCVIVSQLENKERAFELFPNPTIDEVILKGDFKPGQQYRLIDQLGREIRITDRLLPSNNVWKLNLQGLPSGLYWLRVTEKNQIHSFPIIKID